MNARSWVPVPAWWVPVWIVLDGRPGVLDPLEDAVAALVAVGTARPSAIASTLAVPAPLVESALTHLAASGLVILEGEDWRSAPGLPAEMSEPQERAAFVAWDEAVGRPLLQVWLDVNDPDPEELPPVAQGTVLPVPPSADATWPRLPTSDRVDRSLQLLAATGTVVALEPVGGQVREVDGARVVRLRRRPDRRSERGWIWVPVEHRLQGAVVWRPSLLPRPDVETELDPAGWDGLLNRAGALTATLRAAQGEVHDLIAPGVLERTGYRSVEELRSEAVRSADRELNGPVPAEWGIVAEVVAAAFVTQRTAEAAALDWRAVARGWADVLEVVTLELVRRVRPALLAVRLTDAGKVAPDRLRPVLGSATLGHVRKVLRSEEEANRLVDSVRHGTDSIGVRILAIAAAVAADPAVYRAFAELSMDHARFFDDLDRANKDRIAVVHRRDGDEDRVSIVGFRDRVLSVARTSARLRLPES